MPPLVVLARAARGLRNPARQGGRSSSPVVVVVLVLFVIWLLASGHDLVSAVLAAVSVGWAADRAQRVRIDGADA